VSSNSKAKKRYKS